MRYRNFQNLFHSVEAKGDGNVPSFEIQSLTELAHYWKRSSLALVRLVAAVSIMTGKYLNGVPANR